MRFRKNRRFSSFTPFKGGTILKPSSASAVADQVRMTLLARERAQAYRAENPGVVLVKDGKLTPAGIAREIKL